MRDPFPEKSAGDRIHVAHFNRINEVARRVSNFVPGVNLLGVNTKDNLKLSALDPFVQYVVTVTEVGEDDTYTVQRRYYSSTDEEWKTDDEQSFTLDASDLGADFDVGDRVVAFWDDQRGAFIPVVGGPSSGGSMPIIIRTQTGGISARSGHQMGFGTCDVLSTTMNGVLTKIGERRIFNVTDSAVGHCKVGKADPVMSFEDLNTFNNGSVIYIIDVESCTDIDLDGGNCPDDGILDVTYQPNTNLWEWTGTEWISLINNCASGFYAVSPRDGGSTGERRWVACVRYRCCYESDMDGSVTGEVGGWYCHGSSLASNCPSNHQSHCNEAAQKPSYPPTYIGQQVCVAVECLP